MTLMSAIKQLYRRQ